MTPEEWLSSFPGYKYFVAYRREDISMAQAILYDSKKYYLVTPYRFWFGPTPDKFSYFGVWEPGKTEHASIFIGAKFAKIVDR